MEKKTGLTGVGVALLSYAIINAVINTQAIVDLINEDKSFVYDIDDNVNCVASGEVEYSVASSWFLVEVKNPDGKNKLRVINSDGIDILKNEFVTEIHEIDDSYISLDENVLYIESFSNYLIDTERRDYYSPDDINMIIEMIAGSYKWHTEKTLKIVYK